MINVVVYLFFMVFFLIYAINKKYNILAIWLIFYYTIIAIISYVASSLGIVEGEKTSLWAYIFLYLAYMIYFYPFMKKKEDFGVGKLDSNLVNKFKIFAYFYVICSLITICVYFGPITTLVKNGDWAMIRYMYYRDGNVTLYKNVIERLSIIFTLHFYLFAVLIGMLMIKKDEKKLVGYILIGCALITNIMQALLVASRGTIYILILSLVVVFLFALPDMNKKSIKKIIIPSMIIMTIIIPLMVKITISRFGSEAINELLRYFGESPVVFNVNVATMDRPAWGKHILSIFYDTGFSQELFGGSWGYRFYTFVGFLFIDWGPIGTLLIGVIFGFSYINKLVCKNEYKISDLYIIMFYYMFLMKGALVIGRSFAIDVLLTIVIWFGIRVWEKHGIDFAITV